MTLPLRVAINGYGRIGRCFLRAVYEAGLEQAVEVVCINEPADLRSMAHLTRFDSTHGAFPGHVGVAGDALEVNGRSILVTHATEPEGVNWRDLAIDMVIECSGCYSTRSELARFLAAGCPKILLSQPGRSAADVDATVVYGVNHTILNGAEAIVSAASCTTNAVVPVLERLQTQWGIDQVLLTTLHSVMNDQPLIDGYHHSDLRRTRSGIQSMVPVSTGLAAGVERLLPQLHGKVHAKAIRVPILNVSAIDMVISLASPATTDQVNDLMARAATELPGLLGITDAPQASVDFTHNPHSAVVDASQSMVHDQRLVNLLVWFDNEWGFANRMVDVARHWQGLLSTAA